MRIPLSRVEDVTAMLAEPRIRNWNGIEPLGTPLLGKPVRLPLFASRVQAGFPSPAEDYAEGRLDLNEYLVEHEAATFYVRVQGHSMQGLAFSMGMSLRWTGPWKRGMVTSYWRSSTTS